MAGGVPALLVVTYTYICFSMYPAHVTMNIRRTWNAPQLILLLLLILRLLWYPSLYLIIIYAGTLDQ